jgi:transcriptional regulator with XRE-family HTH domain
MAKKKTAEKPARLKKTDIELLKQKAESLFLDTNLTQKQIAEITGMSQQTISKWATEGDPNWEELRKLKSVGRPQALKKLYSKLIALADNDTDNADSIIKITNAIEKLSDRKITIPNTINVMMKFAEYALKQDLDLAKKINTLQKGFIEEVLREPS